MAAGCGVRLARAILITFNIIFCLSGAALLAVGIWLLVDPSVVKVLDVFSAIGSEGDFLKYAAYVLIAVGCFVFVVGFCGCCGALKRNKCLLGVYILLLVIVMALEITAAVLAIVFQGKIDMTIQDKLNTTFSANYNSSTTRSMAFTSGLNFVQANLKCCGISGPSNYPNLIQDFSGEYPVSCCVLKDDVKTLSNLVPEDAKDYTTCKVQLGSAASNTNVQAHSQGCTENLKMWIKRHARILMGVGLGIACLEIFGFIFAVCLCCSIGHGSDIGPV